jgi:Beta-propeller repeat
MKMRLSWATNLFGVTSKGPQKAHRRSCGQRNQLFAELLENRTLLSSTSVLQQTYGQLPLSFEVNDGQTASQVQYLAHGQGYALFLTENSAVLNLTQPSAPAHDKTLPPALTTGVALAMDLIGANQQATVSGLDRQAGVTNYFIGNDPSQWHTNIANYGKVEYQNVYAGINLVYYGNQQQLEYDFVVAPGAKPSDIQLAFSGANSISLDAQGDLVLHTSSGDVLQRAPVIYQDIGGVRHLVAGSFELGDHDQVTFNVGAYDTTRPLTIDPILSYSNYLGGNNSDFGESIAVDASGNAYVTGETASANFPTTTGAYQTSFGGNYDAFVTKVNAGGTAVVYSTYLGGSSDDEAYGIAVDGSGNAYVAGETSSSNFPTTSGAYQTSNGGNYDGFVTKLNPGGTALVYSTYLGGSNYDGCNGIAVNSSGNAFVTGATLSSNFPTTAGAFQSGWSGTEKGFITELNTSGTARVYSTYLGGNSSDATEGIAVDGSGNAYVTGFANSSNFPTTSGAFQTSHASDNGYQDAFVTKLNSSGSALVYSTFLGGNHGDTGYSIAVDSSGDAYVTGATASTNFPVTTGAFQTSNGGGLLDVFVTKLNSTGSGLIYSTYLGGSGEDRGFGIAVNGSGDAFVTGDTQSTSFPTTSDAFQSSFGGTDDAFLTEVNASGSALAYSTYFGGSDTDIGQGIALDSSGNAYITGYTYSTNFPTTNDGLQTSSGGVADAFVAKFNFTQGPNITSVVINQNISALYNAAGQPFAGAQRSMVNDIVYTFSQPVSILAPSVDPNVFTVAVAAGWTGTQPTLNWTSVAGSGDTQWAITFTGNGVTGGSIADGAYTITVSDPGSITAESNGQALSLASSGIGGAMQSFYRLFGDINGDRVVNAADNTKFKQAMMTYNAAFDYNQDGIVNAVDNMRFKNNTGVTFSGFTPTI